MLVLSRKIDDSILIGDDIKIQVIKIKGNTIRIGIEAPSDLKILRGELAPYDIKSERDSNKESTNKKASKPRFANSVTSIEFEATLEEADSAPLPNPFAVAQAS